MKKKLFLFLLVASCVFVACDNEKIGVDTIMAPEPYVTLYYNVSTSPLYEAFGVDEYKTNFLSGDTYYVGVFTYVYDSNGNRVDSLFSHSKTLSQVSQSFTLPKGQYTLITVETLVNGDFNYQPDKWIFLNTEKISTSSIEFKIEKGKENYVDSYFVFYGDVFGVSSQAINLTDNTTLSSYPKPVGSLINTECWGFDDISEYNTIAFATRNQASGYKLNPDLTDEEHIIFKNYNDSKTVEFRTLELARDGKFSFYFSMGTIYIIENRIKWGFAPTNYVQGDGFDSFNWYPEDAFENNEFDLESGQSYTACFIYRKDETYNYKKFRAFLGTYDNYITWWSKNYLSNSRGSVSSISEMISPYSKSLQNHVPQKAGIDSSKSISFKNVKNRMRP